MTSPARSAHLSRNRRLTYASLGIAGIAGLACFLGSTWTGRLGIAVVMIGAAAAVSFAWLEVTRVRVAGHRDWLDAHERRHEDQRAERAGFEAVMGMLRDRNVALARELLGTRDEVVAGAQEVARQQRTIAGLKADQAVLVAERDVLRSRLAEVAEGEEDVTEEVTAEILTLPRRLVRRSSGDQTPWETEDMPSVTSLVTDDAVLHRSATPLYHKQA